MSKDAIRLERIKLAYPKVKAKAEAGNEGAAARLAEYEAELVTLEKGRAE